MQDDERYWPLLHSVWCKVNTQKVKVILKKENGSEIEAAEEYIHTDCFYKLLDKAECR